LILIDYYFFYIYTGVCVVIILKLSPVGRKRQITYRIVVAEKRSKLKGKYIENIGWVDPHADKFKVDKERAEYWINTGGAKPTDSVYNLLVKAGIVEGPKKPVHAKKKISEEEAAAKEAEVKAFEASGENAPSEDKTESVEEESLEEKEGDNVSEEKESEVIEEEKEEKKEEETEEKSDEGDPKQEETPKPEEEVQKDEESESENKKKEELEEEKKED